MNELSLFTGAGGGIWGTKLLGWRCLGYVENNDYCQRVIAQRIADGHFELAPTFGDIQAFLDQGYARRYRGMVDVVTAGFPCTPWSVAGKRRGEADSRNLWPATIATIREVRPRYAFLENVSALLANPYFGTILGDLAESGYDARWCVLGADDVGAPHRRKRLWILAHAQRWGRCEGSKATGREAGIAADRLREDGEARMADADSRRFEECQELNGQAKQDSTDRDSCRGYSGRRDYEKDMADATGEGRQGRVQESHEGRTGSEQRSEEVADAKRKGLEEREGIAGNDGQECTSAKRSRVCWWDIDLADLPDAEEHGRGTRRAGGSTRVDEGIQDAAGALADSDREHGDDWGHGTSEVCGDRQETANLRRRKQKRDRWPVESRMGRVVDELADRINGYISDEKGEDS